MEKITQLITQLKARIGDEVTFVYNGGYRERAKPLAVLESPFDLPFVQFIDGNKNFDAIIIFELERIED